MQVKITKLLYEALLAAGGNAEMFIEDFIKWKSGDEYGSYIFGKDSAYTTPTVDGQTNVLRHVHLVPLTDQNQLEKWNKAWKHGSRKTSDRALVYVDDGKGSFLLIYILDEPDAHNIAKMNTSNYKALMEGFADVAAEFLDNGNVLA